MSEDTTEQKPAAKRWGCWVVLLILGIPVYFVISFYVKSVLASRIMSIECTARNNLSVVYEAQKLYSSEYGQYAKTFAELTYSIQDEPAPLLWNWDGPKAGHTFVMRSQPDGGYEVNADPVKPGKTHVRHFYSDPSGVIRAAMNRPATVSDRPLGE